MNKKDYEKLRREIEDECFAAAFGGGIDPAILDALEAETASPEELEELARRWGMKIYDPIITGGKYHGKLL